MSAAVRPNTEAFAIRSEPFGLFERRDAPSRRYARALAAQGRREVARATGIGGPGEAVQHGRDQRSGLVPRRWKGLVPGGGGSRARRAPLAPGREVLRRALCAARAILVGTLGNV